MATCGVDLFTDVGVKYNVLASAPALTAGETCTERAGMGLEKKERELLYATAVQTGDYEMECKTVHGLSFGPFQSSREWKMCQIAGSPSFIPRYTPYLRASASRIVAAST